MAHGSALAPGATEPANLEELQQWLRDPAALLQAHGIHPTGVDDSSDLRERTRWPAALELGQTLLSLGSERLEASHGHCNAMP